MENEEPAEVYNLNFMKSQNQTSRSPENKLQEVYISNPNNTNLSDTEMNDNKSNPIISVDEKRFDSDNRSEDYQAYENLVKETIDYESLEVTHHDDMPEMAQLLGTTRSAVYTILDNPKYSHFFEFIVIAEKKRITKESFRKFLKGQDRYKLDPSNDYEELAQEQNIALANFRRKKLSQTGIRGSNGNIKYLTFDEASYLAKVSRSMINKWADKGKFTVIKVGSRVRIRRDEFEDWMEQRDLERSMQ